MWCFFCFNKLADLFKTVKSKYHFLVNLFEMLLYKASVALLYHCTPKIDPYSLLSVFLFESKLLLTFHIISSCVKFCLRLKVAATTFFVSSFLM